ncbi:hypothetical protein [Pseudonocardia humida]|uniref:Uncharacterized protein n=1 Tax=Pseudonocardia humida TaxID=2800819 RepID=A0ABT1A5M0_9PSEU|nr:hypothetical protein [Pseudonocardia humida]MCO1658124.1 hypothetical protein [Pseudonocardia humida]
MRVTEQHVSRIPLDNLRVRREEFAAVWAAAEAQDDGADWYVAGVVVTCRWLAGATVRSSTGRSYVASSPISRSATTAHEELIEAEYLAAESLGERQPDLCRSRPGWCNGIRATLRWAWRRNGPAPLAVASVATAAPA